MLWGIYTPPCMCSIQTLCLYTVKSNMPNNNDYRLFFLQSPTLPVVFWLKKNGIGCKIE
jgi:hypothetical protein